MSWFYQLYWWHWVLIVLLNSFLGYWVGVGTLYCWHNLKLMDWTYFSGGLNDRRRMFKSFLVWPTATIDKMRDNPVWQPISMSVSPCVYLIIMIICGPLPKIVLTIMFSLLSGLELLLTVRWRRLLIPKFIAIQK